MIERTTRKHPLYDITFVTIPEDEIFDDRNVAIAAAEKVASHERHFVMLWKTYTDLMTAAQKTHYLITRHDETPEMSFRFQHRREDRRIYPKRVKGQTKSRNALAKKIGHAKGLGGRPGGWIYPTGGNNAKYQGWFSYSVVLMERGIIAYDENTACYFITEKGRDYIGDYR